MVKVVIISIVQVLATSQDNFRKHKRKKKSIKTGVPWLPVTPVKPRAQQAEIEDVKYPMCCKI